MSKSEASGGARQENAGGQAAQAQVSVKIIGSYIWPEMRMICNLFDIANRNYKVDSVGDIFTEQG